MKKRRDLKMQIRVNEIYRHCSGSFYTVLAVSSLRVSNTESRDIVVLKKLSAKGEVVTYYIEDFLAEISDTLADMLGQKFKFVQVKDACFSLAETTTEALVQELKSRIDNPYAKEEDPKVIEVRYEIGVYRPYPKKQKERKGQYYFDSFLSFDTKEEAITHIKNYFHNNGQIVIARVTRAEETSVRELIDSTLM